MEVGGASERDVPDSGRSYGSAGSGASSRGDNADTHGEHEMRTAGARAGVCPG